MQVLCTLPVSVSSYVPRACWFRGLVLRVSSRSKSPLALYTSSASSSEGSPEPREEGFNGDPFRTEHPRSPSLSACLTVGLCTPVCCRKLAGQGTGLCIEQNAIRRHFIVTFLRFYPASLSYPFSVSGSWSPRQCPLWVPSPGVGLQREGNKATILTPMSHSKLTNFLFFLE